MLLWVMGVGFEDTSTVFPGLFQDFIGGFRKSRLPIISWTTISHQGDSHPAGA